jgi:hypothetical protein
LVITLILWLGGDPFADELTLGEEADRRCSRGDRPVRLALQIGAMDVVPAYGIHPAKARLSSLSR